MWASWPVRGPQNSSQRRWNSSPSWSATRDGSVEPANGLKPTAKSGSVGSSSTTSLMRSAGQVEQLFD